MEANASGALIAVRTEVILVRLLDSNSKNTKTYFFDNELGINLAVGAVVLKCKMAAFWALFKFALVPLKVLNVNLVPT